MAGARRIQILLSTYNGEKFLREQLDSFLHQQGPHEVRVLVRDDGSTDATPAILREYAARWGFEVHRGGNLGVNGSWERLFALCDPACDYYAVSDQDDVWLPGKLALAVDALEPYGPGTPALFASRSRVVDAQLHTLGTTPMPERPGFFNAMVQNVCTGHTQVLSRALMRQVAARGAAGAQVIDWWLYLVASAMGRVVYSGACTVLHRQHGGNAVGYTLDPWRRLRLRLGRLFAGEASGLSRQLSAFYRQYADALSSEKRGEIEAFFENQSSFWRRLGYCLTGKVYRQGAAETAALKLLYLMGRYRLPPGEGIR